MSLRHIEEMAQERGVFVNHSTVHRSAIKVLPVMGAIFRRRKRHEVGSWRMDETSIKIACKWKYLFRAVKRVTQAMLGFKSFWNARVLIGGIETMHMICKGQMDRPAGSTVSAAEQFYSLAA